MKKLLALIAFLWVMTACEKSGKIRPKMRKLKYLMIGIFI